MKRKIDWNDKDQVREYRKQYYNENKEKIRKSQYKWNETHTENLNEANKRWRKKNPDYWRKYRASKKAESNE